MMPAAAIRFVAVLLLSAPWAFCQVFADFETSMGSFTCELKHQDAPATVANFVSLAEGSRAWLDGATGRVRTEPFYDGLTFHRVIAGFMNQSGSRNGQGTDDPGYVIQDEADNGLLHDGEGVLSMAKRTNPHTGGAQFFVTVAPAAHLDRLHTVFGRVTSGMPVVRAINQVATGAGDKPLEPVVIRSVTIRRLGAAAEAFDVHAHGLPVVSNWPGELRKVTKMANGVTEEIIDFHPASPQPVGSIVIGYSSENLIDWSPKGTRYLGTGVDDSDEEITLNKLDRPRRFYHLSSVYYPNAMGPENTKNHRLTVTWGSSTRTYQLDATGTAGTATDSQKPGVIENITQAYLDVSKPFEAVWIISTAESGPVAIAGFLDRKEGKTVVGRMKLYVYTIFGWWVQGEGSLTLSVP
jgi:peptidyl-prolyl cis-trans isomerase A (cyclophilin A)